MSTKTYISLFSSAGVGCYGFKIEDFNCIATNELIERRLNIQRYNKKCKYDSGYICGDITKPEIKQRLFEQVALWKDKENVKNIDVIVATPPCQGMSVANHKKSTTEIIRNSLVVESISIIKQIQPKIFIFENVPSFMKTLCTDIDGLNKPIEEAIWNNLGENYSYVAQVFNFKDYGACSSRQRTLVIGVHRNYADSISPYELFPDKVKPKTLRETIGHLPSLQIMGKTSDDDIYHAFRKYPSHMRDWIHDLQEGQSAFDQSDVSKKPHRIVEGKIVFNKQKNGDKYKRQYWDKIGPCIHTRNDQLASQNTIHPSDDRVFSIREIMLMMTVPNTFRWVNADEYELQQLSESERQSVLKQNEVNIRQSLGEAVPTEIFRTIAHKIGQILEKETLSHHSVKKIVEREQFHSSDEIIAFLEKNKSRYSLATLSHIAELANSRRENNAAYFTDKMLITELLKTLPTIHNSNSNLSSKKAVHILEPSVGVGNFLPIIAKKFVEYADIYIDVIDIDAESIQICKALMSLYHLPNNVHIRYLVDDFLTHNFECQYDFIIGNPPFQKLVQKDSLLKEYRQQAINTDTRNICSFFLEKSIHLGEYVALVFPKFLLNTPEFDKTRKYLEKISINSILDFGEKGFPGVLVETIGITLNTSNKPKYTQIISLMKHMRLKQLQSYICDSTYPYWLIYRNSQFDNIASCLQFNVFNVFRDRQITNKLLTHYSPECINSLPNLGKEDNSQVINNISFIRVLKSRNISKTGSEIVDYGEQYDRYITEDNAKKLAVYRYLNVDNVYLVPNMTYKPRMMRKPKGVLTNGSIAILIPKNNLQLSNEQIAFFSSDLYQHFYQVARNYQTRSLNIDNYSVFFFGIIKDREKLLDINQ